MARSIGDWFADHARHLRDDAHDDEVVEPQAPWDTRSTGMATTRAERRGAGFGGGQTSRRASTSASGRQRGGDGGGSRTAGGPSKPGPVIPDVLRRRIIAAARANSRADAKSLAAHLTRAGTPVTAAQVAAVTKVPVAATEAQKGTTSRTDRPDVAAAIRRAAAANLDLGPTKLAALLRSRGTAVSKAQVKEVLARRRSSATCKRPPAKAKPGLVIKVKAGAQASRTVHETPLCPSCGLRLNVYAMCRCS